VSGSRAAGRASAGWWLLLAAGVLLLTNGLWLTAAVRTPEVFAQDTGVALAEVLAAYPRVVDVMHVRGTLIGVLVSGLGALVLALAWGGRRDGWRTARSALAVVAALLLALAVVGFTAESAAVGAVYLFFALATGTGVALTAPSASTPGGAR